MNLMSKGWVIIYPLFFSVNLCMDVFETRLGVILNNVRKLDDALAFVEAFDAQLRVDILDYIRQDQLRDKGVNEDDVVIGEYSYATQAITKGRKKAGDHYTLEDTGAFFRSMTIRVTKDYIEINADGQKDEDNLFEKYGEGIIGLNEESLTKVINQVKDRIQQYFYKVLSNY